MTTLDEFLLYARFKGELPTECEYYNLVEEGGGRR